MTETSRTQMVLDSWPLIEWLKGHKPTQDRMAAILVEAARAEYSLSISRIKLGEVIYIGRKEVGMSEAGISQMLNTFSDVPIRVVSATDSRVDAAIDLKSHHSISFADAFAAGLSVELDAPLVTGDKEFRALEAKGIVRLHWLGA